MLGAMGWTAERSEVMLLTDPIYYFGTLLAQKSSNNYHTFADMAGKKVGTVTGFTLVPELKAVPGIGEAKLYDTSDGVMRDLVAGRIDMAILDPPLVALAIKEHPEWDLHQVQLDPDPNFPIMSTKYNVVMGIRKDGTALAEAVNTGIANLWATCTNQALWPTTASPTQLLPAAGPEPPRRGRPGRGLAVTDAGRGHAMPTPEPVRRRRVSRHDRGFWGVGDGTGGRTGDGGEQLCLIAPTPRKRSPASPWRRCCG